MNTVSNNLSTFRTLFLIKGILTFFFSLFFLIYAFAGVFFAAIPEMNQQPPNMPFDLPSIFMAIGMVGFVLTVALGVVTIMASNYLNRVEKRNFIFVVSILNCLTGILGILLGVFTIVELNKPHVKELFDKG